MYHLLLIDSDQLGATSSSDLHRRVTMAGVGLYAHMQKWHAVVRPLSRYTLALIVASLRLPLTSTVNVLKPLGIPGPCKILGLLHVQSGFCAGGSSDHREISSQKHPELLSPFVHPPHTPYLVQEIKPGYPLPHFHPLPPRRRRRLAKALLFGNT
jgi:hypothetical protein